MKKIVLGILVMQLVFLLAGCADTIIQSDEPEINNLTEPSGNIGEPKEAEPAREPGESGLPLPRENSEDQQVMNPEPEPELEPNEEPEPYVFPEKWNLKNISDFCEKTGRFSDVYNFTIGDLIEVVTAEVGEETSDPNVRDFYKEYGPELWVFYFGKYGSPEEKVANIALNRGATYFGMEVGKSTLSEVLEQLEVERSRVILDAHYGFSPGSPGEPEEPPVFDQRYKQFSIGLQLKDQYECEVYFYFTDDILETVFIYTYHY